MTTTSDVVQLRKEARARLQDAPMQLISLHDHEISSSVATLTPDEQIVIMLSRIAASLYGLNRMEIYSDLLKVRNALMAEMDKGRLALEKEEAEEQG